MSYNARSGGHGYGNQRRGSSYAYPYSAKSKPPVANKVLPLKKTAIGNQSSINQPTESFILLAQGKQTWDKPAWSSRLPNNADPKQLAFELVQANSERKNIELQVIDSKTQKTSKYLLRRIEEIEDPEQLQPENIIMPIETQSFEVHERLSNINNQLKLFGFSLVHQKGLSL